MSLLSKIRLWFVVPVVALASFATAPAQGQLACEAPLDAGLGVTEFATLPQFPERQVTLPCWSSWSIHHAVYLNFTAPQDGWYAIYAMPVSGASWIAHMAVLAECDGPALNALKGGWAKPWCSAGNPNSVYVSYCSVWMQQGESRTIVVGGQGSSDAGQGELRIERIGATLMEGAQPLSLGSNSFSVQGLEPCLPYEGACPSYAMPSASRFTFVPSKTGTYQFGFCNSYRQFVAISDSPNLTASSLVQAQYGCGGSTGGKLATSLQAGTTYYIAAGWDAVRDDACLTKNATVEYFDPCPADLNDDDSVDGKDLAILISGWGTAEADITGDGNTDGVDLGILLASWGPCTR